LPDGTLERPMPGSRLSPFVSTPAVNTGSVSHQLWSNQTGAKVANMVTTATPTLVENITTGIDYSVNRADNYSERFQGYLYPTTSGSYTFYVEGDDQVDFYISTNNNPANKARKAYVNWSTPVHIYTTESTQTSATITLTANTQYYFEVLHKEGTSNDHVALSWKTPAGITEIIPAANMIPYSATGARMGAEEEAVTADVTAPSFSLFPNPANSQVTIRASRPAGTTWHLELISQVGQKVLAIEDIDASATAEASLDLTRYNLIPGLYLVRLRDGEGRLTTHKFVKSE
jgi:hypothetical protein